MMMRRWRVSEIRIRIQTNTQHKGANEDKNGTLMWTGAAGQPAPPAGHLLAGCRVSLEPWLAYELHRERTQFSGPEWSVRFWKGS